MSRSIDTVESSLLRQSDVVMNLKRMGAMHQSRISFTRSLIRKMSNENWLISKSVWNLCKDGYGTVIYELKTPNNIYNLVIFSNKIEDDERNDRVIAEKWDTTFTLIEGDVSDKLLEMLKSNVPLQEAGRNTNRAMVLARANKSVRVFDHVVDSLSNGKQPNAKVLSNVGYILRTTAVYGSGKFGITDFDNIKTNPDFSQSFSAEMCAVYILRQFSLDWVNYLAKSKGGDKAVSLNRDTQRYLGIGNATGLGMAPYLIRHPKVVDNWLYQRESALSKVSLQKITLEKSAQINGYLQRATLHLRDVVTINEAQRELNLTASKEVPLIVEKINNSVEGTTSWKDIIFHIEQYSFEAQEVTISSILELYPELVDVHEEHMTIDEQPLELSGVSIKDLKDILKEKYSWAIDIDFSKADSNYWFWYVSEDKEEPRLGIRNVDKGSELEQPLDIARQAYNLNNSLINLGDEEPVAKFLLQHPEFTSITRRVWTMGNCNMGEIQANVLDKAFLPMDLLRAKLAMFGATKFDPRSDRWVQVTFFQSAPLSDEIHANEWLFPLLPKNIDDRLDIGEDKIRVSQNELKALCIKAFNGLNLNSGEADLVAKMVIDLEMVGLHGTKHFVKALKYLKNDNAFNVNIKSHDNKIDVDLGSCSILSHIQIIVAYAIDHMRNHDSVIVEIKNCHNKWLAYSQLKRLSQKGFNVKIKWSNTSLPQDVEYVIAANDSFPCVNISKSIDNDINTLRLEINKKEFAKDDSINVDKYISSKDLKKSFDKTVEEGILIEKDDWEAVKLVARGILVESSESSRNDAGGVVENKE